MTDKQDKPKFTPGPWRIQDKWEIRGVNNGVKGYEPVERDGVICTINSWLLQGDANAALIAAAPEMYELLDDIRANYQAMPNPVEVERRIEAVLAKARGETEQC